LFLLQKYNGQPAALVAAAGTALSRAVVLKYGAGLGRLEGLLMACLAI